MGLDSPSRLSNIWEVQPSNVFSNVQSIETILQPLNSLIALPPMNFPVEQHIHDLFSPLSGYGHDSGASRSANGCETSSYGL